MRVETAAVRAADGSVHTLPRPARHADIRMQMIRSGVLEEGTSGFLLTDGTFVDRQTAGAVAFRAGQTKARCWQLETIDLW